ncbi:hypothetical protein [Loigolactobacillus jiayinensis]|uniref:Uncharacterized protein n=1 Tax=Loigolactobacillus jiayinensis TaxID=2486016 RepID=A0ABW1RG61_9LACO|nr:hypothetical protein [Loigolactobacillus jiayinensis]
MDEQAIQQADWQISFKKQPEEQKYTGDVSFNGGPLAAAVVYIQLMTEIAKKTQVVSDKRKFYLATKEIGQRDGFAAGQYQIQYIQSALLGSGFDFTLTKEVGESLADSKATIHFRADPMSCVWPTEIIGKALAQNLTDDERASFNQAVSTAADTQMASLEQLK